ncbi:MAG: response regulator [Myxococcales bacterium]|nr:response regulator [Myxococcales bacterium]
MTENKRLLIAEDDAAIVKLEQTLLASAGYDFDAAGTVAEAVTALKSRTYHAVPLDAGLPDESGFALGERIRRDPEPGHPNVIFLTARADAASTREGFSVGGVFYLTKPFSKAKLLDVVMAVTEMG